MRTSGSVGKQTEERIYEAAAELVAENGYDSGTLRKLAEKVGIQVGSLYNHISSKQDLLVTILEDAYTKLLDPIRTDVLIRETPLEKLQALVKVHVSSQISRHIILVSRTQLNHLTPENFAKIQGLRNEYYQYVEQILLDGADMNIFDVKDVHMLKFSISGMLASVLYTFNRGNMPAQKDLESFCIDLVTKMVGYKPKP